MLLDFATVFVFLVAGCIFILFSTTVSRILHKKVYSAEKFISYECGEDPVGDTRVKFDSRFYIIALIFLIFDVEIVVLFPWAVVFKELGTFAFIEMMIFVFLLLIGLAYVWAKGDLEWIKTVKPRRDIGNRQ